MANPHRHAASVGAALLPLLDHPPRLMVVQGDTSSAFGAAAAAFAADVDVAHVEAGLRTHDPAMPWPEEEYRTAIDAGASLLFAPTELAAANLSKERVKGQVFVTGNTAVDALLATLGTASRSAVHDRAMPRILVTCHRRENWGERLQGIATALRKIADDGTARIELLLPPNAHVADVTLQLLGGCSGVTLLQPCRHAELIARMLACDLMLSDSGGVQEEAPALGVPLLVLREKTERPEAIATGNMGLIGTDPERIAAEVRSLLADPERRAAMSVPAFPYGDGLAGQRIARIIDDWLSLNRPDAALQRRPRLRHSGPLEWSG